MNEPSGVIPMFRSIGAVLVGIIVNVLLSVVTDRLVYSLGFAHAGQRMPDRWLAIAAAYRIVFSVISSYIIAALAGRRPMLHSMVAGTLGLVVSIAGAVTAWNQVETYGPHWYPIVLVVATLPTAWLGARWYLSRIPKPLATADAPRG
jgi:hypothetical protein